MPSCVVIGLMAELELLNLPKPSKKLSIVTKLTSRKIINLVFRVVIHE